MNRRERREMENFWAGFIKRVREDALPKIQSSAVVISLLPEGEPDIKFAVELGLSILLDKPLIAAMRPGAKIPRKLALVVDRFVEFDPSDPTTRDRIADAIREMLAEKKP
jgi:hypothetical protein